MENISIKEQREIGTKAFKILLKNNWNRNALIPLSNEYGISLNDVYRYSEEYRKSTLEPHATEEEIILYKKIRQEEDLWVKDLLSMSDDELKKYISTLNNKDYLIDKISQYCSVHKEEISTISQLLNIKFKIESTKKPKEPSEVYKKVLITIKRFLENDNEYYPNNIWQCVTGAQYSQYSYFLRKVENLKDGTSEQQEYYKNYKIVQEQRREKFKKIAAEFYQDYKNGVTVNGKRYKLDCLYFYQKYGMRLKDFKSFCSIARSNKDIPREYYDIIAKYYNGLQTGEISILTEDILKMKFYYKTTEVSKELKKDIVIYLVAHNIPLTRNNMDYAINHHFEGRLEETLNLAKEENQEHQDEFKKKIYESIDEYINMCDDVLLIDKILDSKGLNRELFLDTLDKMKNGTEKDKQYYKFYLETYYTRAQCIKEIVLGIIENYQTITESNQQYSPLDYYMKTSIKPEKLKQYVQRLNETNQYQPKEILNKEQADLIDNILRTYNLNYVEISEEELLKSTYTTNGRKLSIEEKFKIVNYIKENQIPLTMSIFHAVVQKYLNGSIILSKSYE